MSSVTELRPDPTAISDKLSFAPQPGHSLVKKTQTHTLRLDGWSELCEHLALSPSPVFSERAVRLVFASSRMTVIDEARSKSRKKVSKLCFEDFLEAIVRLATLVPLPTYDDLRVAKAKDAGDFLVRMQTTPPPPLVNDTSARGQPEALPGPREPSRDRVLHECALQVNLLDTPDEFEAFQLSHGPKAATQESPAMGKVAVALPRATRVSFLLCYTVRLIEYHAAQKGELDGQVSKAEIKYFLSTGGRSMVK